MNCGHCGTHVPDGYVVCTGCGAHYRNDFRAFGLGALVALIGFGNLIAGWSHIPGYGKLIAFVIGCFGVFLMSQMHRKAWFRVSA